MDILSEEDIRPIIIEVVDRASAYDTVEQILANQLPKIEALVQKKVEERIFKLCKNYDEEYGLWPESPYEGFSLLAHYIEMKVGKYVYGYDVDAPLDEIYQDPKQYLNPEDK